LRSSARGRWSGRRGWLACCLASVLGAGGAHGADSAPAIIVTVSRDLPAAELEAVAERHGLAVAAVYPLAALRVQSATLVGQDAAPPRRDTLQALRAESVIRSAQARRLHAVAAMPPKDPYFDLQMRTRQGGVTSVLRRGNGRNVRIAIIDTGVDLNHPDLRGQILDARNFVGGDPQTVPAEFHGTAVTGLIAARGGNGIGIHGLADEAQVYALRACWEPTYALGVCSTDTLAQALDYAIEARARIINLSVAGPDDPLLTRLVERAVELGAVVFGAIGEEPGQSFPANISSVIAVEQNRRSEVVVPGERLTIPGQQLLTTVPGGRYDFVSGPSFATAHASGVAAVMLEMKPHLRPHQIADWLRRLHGNAS